MPCGAPHTYHNINESKINRIMDTLKKNGAVVTGNNPWKVDTKNFGIKLLGTWDLNTSILTVQVTDKSFFVPCEKIWENLDPMINKVAASDMIV